MGVAGGCRARVFARREQVNPLPSKTHTEPTWNLSFSTMTTISKDFSFWKGISYVISSQPHFSLVRVLQTMQLDLLKRGLK
jgi:hypothetical protein